MIGLRGLAVLAALALWTTPAACQGQSREADAARAEIDRAQQGNDPDMTIKALGRLIAAPDATAAERASAYELRATAYFLHKHQLDPAVADMDAAISLFPNQAEFRVRRGSFLSTAGKPELALADFDVAQKLAPDTIGPYRARGLALLHMSRFDAAATDLTHTLTIDPNWPFVVFELHIIRLRTGVDDKAEFTANAAHIPANGWPAPIVEFYAGRLTAAALLQAAQTAPEADRAGWVCEANYYAGEAALAAKDTTSARRLLQAAADICPFDYSELSGARADFERLH